MVHRPPRRGKLVLFVFRAPPTVDEVAAHAARMAAKQAHALSRPTHASSRYRIKLRRFAGPVTWSAGRIEVSPTLLAERVRISKEAVPSAAVFLSPSVLGAAI